MFFSEVSEIRKIALGTGAAVFVVPRSVEVTIPGAIIIKPEGKSQITIEQIRELISQLSVKQLSEQYIIIRPAEAMNPEASNAFLKTLEEPKEKVHFILITDSPSSLLTTILSRAEMYYYRQKVDFMKIDAGEKIIELAKELMVVKPSEVVNLAEKMTKKKDGVREYVLEIVGTTIEMLYKSYFLTKKEVFLNKIPAFLKLYEALMKNGHVKLQIVSNLC